MALELYDVSIPVYLQGMRNLQAIMDKAETHAKEAGDNLSDYLGAKLADDMLPFTRQIQMVSDTAKGGAGRLAGVTPPAMPDEETTWDQLKERLAKTIAFVESIKPDQVHADPTRKIEMQFPGRTMSFTARDFLFGFSLPNFFFHITTAYGMLRHKGVPLGKADYLMGAAAASF